MFTGFPRIYPNFPGFSRISPDFPRFQLDFPLKYENSCKRQYVDENIENLTNHLRILCRSTVLIKDFSYFEPLVKKKQNIQKIRHVIRIFLHLNLEYCEAFL